MLVVPLIRLNAHFVFRYHKRLSIAVSDGLPARKLVGFGHQFVGDGSHGVGAIGQFSKVDVVKPKVLGDEHACPLQCGVFKFHNLYQLSFFIIYGQSHLTRKESKLSVAFVVCTDVLQASLDGEVSRHLVL